MCDGLLMLGMKGNKSKVNRRIVAEKIPLAEKPCLSQGLLRGMNSARQAHSTCLGAGLWEETLVHGGELPEMQLQLARGQAMSSG